MHRADLLPWKAKQRRMARVTAPLRLDPRIVLLTCEGDAAQPFAVGVEQYLPARAVDGVVVDHAYSWSSVSPATATGASRRRHAKAAMLRPRPALGARRSRRAPSSRRDRCGKRVGPGQRAHRDVLRRPFADPRAARAMPRASPRRRHSASGRGCLRRPLAPTQRRCARGRRADHRQALEQLCRYITRPALANERVQCNAAGQVVLKLKTPYAALNQDLAAGRAGLRHVLRDGRADRGGRGIEVDIREHDLRGERLAFPSELTTLKRRRSRRPGVRGRVSASGAATVPRCGYWRGWEAARAHRAGTPKDRVR